MILIDYVTCFFVHIDNSVGKPYTPGFSTPEDNSTTGTVVGMVNGMDPPDQSFPVSEHTTATNGMWCLSFWNMIWFMCTC